MVVALKKNERGQTTVEWLLLTAMVFITSYIVIGGPLATYTTKMIENIRTVTTNIVRNGEMDDQGRTQGTRGHPSDRTRLKPLHL